MSREIFNEDHIIDSTGFIIDSNGYIFTNYYDIDGNVYFMWEGSKKYYKDLILDYGKPVFKHIKQLKKSKLWKTYVTSNVIEINCNASFKTEYEAAHHVNILFIKYGLNRVPNVVPIKGY